MVQLLHAMLPYVFATAWLGGSAYLFVQYRTAQRRYLRQFDSVDGVPLEHYLGSGLPRVSRAIRQAMLEQQVDADLELQRKYTWTRYRWMAVWMLCFPVVVGGIAVLLAVTGHYQIVH